MDPKPTNPAADMAVVIGGRSIYLGRFPYAGHDPKTGVGTLALMHSGAMATLRSLEAKRAELEGDPRLSDLGRSEKLQAFARSEVLPRLARLRLSLPPYADAIAEQAAKLSPVRALDPGDAVGELRRQEVREFVRSLPQEERALAVMRDPSLREAVLDAPAALSGLTPEYHAALAREAIADAHPEAVQDLTELTEARDATAKAIREAWSVALSVSGISGHDGDALAAKVEEADRAAA